MDYVESTIRLLKSIRGELNKENFSYNKIVGRVSEHYVWWVETEFPWYTGEILDEAVSELYNVELLKVSTIRLFRNNIIHFVCVKKDYGIKFTINTSKVCQVIDEVLEVLLF